MRYDPIDIHVVFEPNKGDVQVGGKISNPFVAIGVLEMGIALLRQIATNQNVESEKKLIEPAPPGLKLV